MNELLRILNIKLKIKIFFYLKFYLKLNKFMCNVDIVCNYKMYF